MANGIERLGFPGFEHFADRLEAVRSCIREQLRSRSGNLEVSRLIEHVCAGSGKMLRPGLVMAAGEAVGSITDTHVTAAAVVEMIHNATLLHDDVIDDGQKRRGRPTANRLWGNESAVLLGDFMLSRVFRMCLELDSETMRVIAAATTRVCEGELRQVIEKHNWRLDEAEYLDIIAEKSASLLSSCCYLGALHAGGAKQQCESLADFGMHCGIAFQIADDILDITGDETKMGKSVGSDLDMQKPTLALIHFLNNSDDTQRSEIERRLDAAMPAAGDLPQLLASAGSLDYARGKAQEHVDRGIAALAALKPSNATDLLARIARFMVDRTA